MQDIINRMSAGQALATLPEALRAILDGASPLVGRAHIVYERGEHDKQTAL